MLAEVLGVTGYESVLACHEDPYWSESSLADLESLQWLAFQFREMGLGEFLRRLSAQDRQANQKEEISGGEDAEAVHIMTVHAAKGLEFPVVFVPRLDYNWTRAGFTIPPPVRGFNSNNLVCKVLDQKGKLQKPFSFEMAEREDLQRRQAENKRLFYVACTRAADLLILSGWAKSTSPKAGKLWSSELEAALKAARNQDVTASGNTDRPLFSAEKPVILECSHECDLVKFKSERSARAPKAGRKMSQTQISEAEFDIRMVSEPAISNIETRQAARVAGGREEATGREPLQERQRGELVHEVLGFWAQWFRMPEAELSKFVTSRLHAYPLLDSSDAKIAVERLLSLQKLRFGQEIGNARRLITEMPLTTVRNGAAKHLRLDLLFQDQNDEWHIVDWKTGGANQNARGWSERPDDACKVFRTQLSEYVAAFADVYAGVVPKVYLGLLDPRPEFVELIPEDLNGGRLIWLQPGAVPDGLVLENRPIRRRASRTVQRQRQPLPQTPIWLHFPDWASRPPIGLFREPEEQSETAR